MQNQTWGGDTDLLTPSPPSTWTLTSPISGWCPQASIGGRKQSGGEDAGQATSSVCQNSEVVQDKPPVQPKLALILWLSTRQRSWLVFTGMVYEKHASLTVGITPLMFGYRGTNADGSLVDSPLISLSGTHTH